MASTAKTSRADAPRKLPDPGSVALLGTVLELLVREKDGRVVQHSWMPPEGLPQHDRSVPGPNLFWSPRNKALIFFPTVERLSWKELNLGDGIRREGRLDMREAREVFARHGIELPSDVQEAAKLFTDWAARPATRVAQKDVDEYPLKLSGEGVNIIYRSDKWNGRDGKRVNYTHPFSKSGAVKVSCAAGHPPKAFYIKGGRMTVNARGIVY